MPFTDVVTNEGKAMVVKNMEFGLDHLNVKCTVDIEVEMSELSRVH